MQNSVLWSFEKIRPRVLTDVVSHSFDHLKESKLELLMGEALYTERVRMRRNRAGLFTKGRRNRDRALWGRVQGGLLTPPALQDRNQLLKAILEHYAEEIGGHFDPKVYGFAIRTIPWLFSWLLNVASHQRFNPWKITSSVASQIPVVGETEMLRRLCNRGTVLLVPTHQSNIDSILIGYAIYLLGLPPFAYGAGLNLFSNPILSYFMGNLGAYTVDRQKSNPIYKEVLKNYSTEILKSGVHSIFFPGGGRSRSGAIESKLKLGLLGTGLQAQIDNYLIGKPDPSIFVVPMVMSYHFVLEAESLIEDFLADSGKSRFIISDDEFWQPTALVNFIWRLFSAQNGITVRIGKAMDVFGNLVDEEGRSMGPNGTTIDPKKWLTTRGELCANVDRDQVYTKELGKRLVERFHTDNTVLSSHLVSFAFFEVLRKQYRDLDLYRFLRISLAQRTLPFDNFIKQAEVIHKKVKDLAAAGKLYIDAELQTEDTEKWVKAGMRHLSVFHGTALGAAVLRVSEGAIWTDDMNLLYYYRNRLEGYGLTE